MIDYIENEIWKDVAGFKGQYKISNLGRVYSVRTQLGLKTHIKSNGYEAVHFTVGGKMILKSIHVLVAKAFIKDFNKREYIVKHLDGNKLNNASNNLELTKESIQKRKNNKNLTSSEVELIKEFITSGLSVKEIANKFNINQSVVYDIGNGRTHTKKVINKEM